MVITVRSIFNVIIDVIVIMVTYYHRSIYLFKIALSIPILILTCTVLWEAEGHREIPDGAMESSGRGIEMLLLSGRA